MEAAAGGRELSLSLPPRNSSELHHGPLLYPPLAPPTSPEVRRPPQVLSSCMTPGHTLHDSVVTAIQLCHLHQKQNNKGEIPDLQSFPTLLPDTSFEAKRKAPSPRRLQPCGSRTYHGCKVVVAPCCIHGHCHVHRTASGAPRCRHDRRHEHMRVEQTRLTRGS